ncbi:MAG: CHRD domain-containing protein [Betaproteobacteria bacterium]|nr:MAG: CHRD domain-containing protein [Betaproteobacteria bacterium]TMH69110.1 MAG: CHRD domain-containing protein [Betaproteobacteria bacterium]
MNPAGKASKRSAVALALSWAGMLAFALTLPALSKDMAVTLAGDQEVPAVTTSATGTGTISVAADKAVSGSIMVKGVSATAAHIHEAAKGKNGPVIIPLTKSGDSTFTVPAGAKLTDEQMKSLESGNLYVNVHSAANPNGEIRAQLGP